jgi:hypothetical protein
MASITIYDSLKDDPRFISCCVSLKSRQKAIGYWYEIALLAQSYWKQSKSLIPFDVYAWNKFPKCFQESGIVEKLDAGYYLKGSEQFFAWILSCVENGKKGGRPLQAIGNIEEAETHGVTQRKPTSKPSSSSSSSNNNTYKNTIHEFSDDAVLLVKRLKELMLGNNPRARLPENDSKWLKSADLLLKKDKYDLSEAMSILEWSQQNEFWRMNILSMTTFREKINRLKIQHDTETGNTKEDKYAEKVLDEINNYFAEVDNGQVLAN